MTDQTKKKIEEFVEARIQEWKETADYYHMHPKHLVIHEERQRQHLHRTIRFGLELAKDAGEKTDTMGCMQERCSMGGGLGDVNKGTCETCHRSAALSAKNSAIQEVIDWIKI